MPFASRLLKRTPGWLHLPGLFLVIVGAKLCVLRANGSPLPFFDAWMGEGNDLLRPWMEGTWRWTESLWEPFYQHRIALTRLFVLGVFTANGQQWDVRVEAALATGIHAAVAVGLTAILARRVGGLAPGGWTAAAGLLFALPFGWENTLAGGFQTQFYFLLGLSVLAIRGLATQPARSVGWWVGVTAAALAWVSIASGPLAGLAVALWAGARLALRDGERRENLTTLTAGAALFLGGIGLSLGVPQTDRFRPESLGELLRIGAGFASWPFLVPALAVAAWLPFAALAFRRVRERRLGGRAERFLLPFGLWVLLQTAALAVARGRAGGLGVSRYMDLLSPGVLVNLGCLQLLVRESLAAHPPDPTRTGRWSPPFQWTVPAAALWVAAVVAALGVRTAHALRDELPTIRFHNAREREHVAAFVATGNGHLFERATIYDFQSNDFPATLELLGSPAGRAMLPACARPPLVLEADRAERFARGARIPTTPNPLAPPEPAWASAASEAAPGAAFRSQPLRTTLPYLEFAVFGAAGTPGAEIALVSERDPAAPRVVLPPGRGEPGEGWRRVVVKAPPSPFRVEATVTGGGAGRNLALTSPREMGPLSAAVERLLDAGVETLFLGLALCAGAGWWGGRRRLAGELGTNDTPSFHQTAA